MARVARSVRVIGTLVPITTSLFRVYRPNGGKKKMYFSGSPLGQDVVPECEIVFENDGDTLTTRYSKCKKHPEHENFIPVSKFTVKHIPPEHRNVKTMDEIFRRCALTVRIKISYTSMDRPDTYADTNKPYPFSEYKGSHRVVRYGTGTIVQAFYQHESLKVKSCPCQECNISGKHKQEYWWVRVRTATHVIHDRSEAECSEFDCFFDSDDRKGVKTIYGFDTFNVMMGSDKKFRHDVCDILCVTHDWSTIEALSRINPQQNFLHPPTLSTSQAPSRVIVSHPHGCSKKLTVGDVLQLTVPISEDYPTDCNIPFKKGTFYRKVSSQSRKCNSNSGNVELKSSGKERNLSDEHDPSKEVGLENYDLKAKLDSVLALPLDTTANVVETEDDSAQSSVPASMEDYLVDFYNLFLREHCLKILIACTILHHRVESQRIGKKSQNLRVLWKPVFDEMRRTFLGKTLESAAELDEKTSRKIEAFRINDSDLTHRFWLQLWKESEEDYAQFKALNDSPSEMNSHPSFLVSWFAEIEKIMDMVVAAKLKEGKVIDEDVIPPVVENGLKAGLKILMKFEELRKNDKCQEDSVSAQREEDEILGKEGDEAKVALKVDDDGEGKDRNKREERGHENAQSIPDGATFTLPPEAEYAFRMYRENPGWFSFPPGTVMKSPDGTEEEIGYPKFEFMDLSIQPERGYVDYNTNTCPGSSGANVYCDMLGPYMGTYFPHSGSVGDGQNRSGIRDNAYTLFSKMLLFDPRRVLSKEGIVDGSGKCNGSKNEPMSLFEGCKLLLLNMKKILVT